MLAVSFDSRMEHGMGANMGAIDRSLRIIAGLVVLSLIFFIEGSNRWWGLLGLVPLATGFVGWCPAYLPFGISTRKGRTV
jgi:Inner membrane protein YgaP-like, transmembrane domain